MALLNRPKLLITLSKVPPARARQEGVQGFVDALEAELEASTSGNVSGPSSSVDGDFAQFDGITGLLIKDGGISFDTDDTLNADSDSRIPSQAAVKSYVDNATSGIGAVTPPITENDYGVLFTIPDTGLLLQPSRATFASTERITLAGTGRDIIYDPPNNPYQKGAYNQPPFILRSGEFLEQYTELQMNGNERATLTENSRIILFDGLGSTAGVTTGNLTDAGTDGITVTGGTGAVVGSGTSLSQHVADGSHNGYLSLTDWNTFSGKQSALTFSDSVVNTAGTVTLVNDSASPGASKYYGTNAGSTLGFFSIPTVSGSALTKTDDTNVTLTLGGSPSTALVNAASVTAGWTGTLAPSRGGTGIGTLPSSGQILVGNAGGTAYAPQSLAGGSEFSASISSAGVLSISDFAGPTTRGLVPDPGAAIPAAPRFLSDGATWLTAGGGGTGLLSAPVTQNDYGVAFTIPDTGNLGQPSRFTLASTERLTSAGTGRLTVFDPSNNPYQKGAYNQPPLIIRSGEYVEQLARLIMSGKETTTLTEDARIFIRNEPLSAGGSNTQVQFNSHAGLGGIANMTSDGTNVTSMTMGTSTPIQWSTDTGIVRNAASVFELNNGTTGAWAGLKLGTKDAGTSNVPVALNIGHQTTASGASISTGYGVGVSFNLDDDTVRDHQAGQITVAWSTPQEGSGQNAYMSLQLYHGNSGLNEAMRLFTYQAGTGSISVGDTTDPGVVGIVNAHNGFMYGGAAATAGKILQASGGFFVPSSITWPVAASTSGKIVQSNGTNLVMSTQTFPTTSVPGQSVIGDGTNFVNGSPAPVTINDYSTGGFTIPDTGGLNQPTRSTLASTERMTVAGTGRETIFDPSNSVLNIPSKAVSSPPSFILRAGEFIEQLGQLVMSGLRTATLTENARIVCFDLALRGSRLILTG